MISTAQDRLSRHIRSRGGTDRDRVGVDQRVGGTAPVVTNIIIELCVLSFLN
jgi:hypothetical protein